MGTLAPIPATLIVLLQQVDLGYKPSTSTSANLSIHLQSSPEVTGAEFADQLEFSPWNSFGGLEAISLITNFYSKKKKSLIQENSFPQNSFPPFITPFK